MSYIAQGFNVANKSPMQVTLIKRKQFSVFWAVIGFIVCVLPLLIYLIIYALEDDQMVTITVTGASTGQLAGTPPLTYSGALSAPQPPNYPDAPRSPDGNYWWDGQAWQLIPQSEQTGPMGQPPTGPMGQPPTGPMGQPPTGPMGQPPTGPMGQPPTGPMGQPPTGPMGY